MRSMLLSLLFAMCLSGLSVSTASAGQASGLELNAQAVKDIATAIGAGRNQLRAARDAVLQEWNGLTSDQRRNGLTKTVTVDGQPVTITLKGGKFFPKISMSKTVTVGGQLVTITQDGSGKATLAAGGVDLGRFNPYVNKRTGEVRLDVTSINSQGKMARLRLSVNGNTMSTSLKDFKKLLGQSTRYIGYKAKATISSIVLSVVTQTRANTTRQITVATLSGAVSP